MSQKIHMSDRLHTEGKSNVWQEILTLQAKHGSLDLALGFPDFKPPEHILNALADTAIDDNYMLHHYTRGIGHPRLVKVLARMYGRLIGREVSPMTEVVVTVGAFEALFAVCQGLINPGDEVVLIEPYYEPYKEMLRLAGAKHVYVPLHQMGKTANDWTFNRKELADAFSNRTKAIFVNNPQNPLGKVYSKEELEFISQLCIQHDVLCVSDEVYEWLTYDGKKHTRIASLPNMWERTITIGSAGKTFTVTGWKVGWAIGPEHLIKPLQLFHHHSIRTHCTPTQEAVAVAFETELGRLDMEDCYFNILSKEMEQTRQNMCHHLSNAGIHPVVPGGGYFIVADISKIDTNGDLEKHKNGEPYDFRFVKWAIQNMKLTMIPMSIFYSPEHKHLGENYVRICFVKKEETVEKVRDILLKWIGNNNCKGLIY